MGTENLDELEARRPFEPLPIEATNEEVVEAVNAMGAAIDRLAKSSRTHSVELEGIRLAIQEHGTRIETFCQRIEIALGIARSRTTDPAPAPGGDTL